MQLPDFSQNYFELFGLQANFDIDSADLRRAQQRLQSTYHPDRFAAASGQEKRLSVQMASLINQAYQTLRDPVKRSRYLLEIRGVELPDDSQTTADHAFLMEQIELREAIDTARQAEDALDRCWGLARQLDQRSTELERAFVSALETDDTAAAIDGSRKLQFIQRIRQQLDDVLFDLEES